MGIPRFLLASVAVLFLAVCAFSASAQSLPLPRSVGSSKFSSPPIVISVAPLRALAGHAAAGNVLRPEAAGSIAPGFSFWVENRPYLTARASCYALRVYRFAEIRPGSGVMRSSGSSTCEAASLFHLKDVTSSAKGK